jgi:hypothetical protein
VSSGAHRSLPEKIRWGRWRIKNKKIEKTIKKKRKRKGHYRHFTFLFIFTQSEEAILPNVFLKRLQLHKKSRSTRGAGAEAVLVGARALPNGPLISGSEGFLGPWSMKASLVGVGRRHCQILIVC